MLYLDCPQGFFELWRLLNYGPLQGTVLDIKTKHRELLRTLWTQGPLSRLQIHRLLGVRPNTVSDLVAELIEAGILTEGMQEAGSMGRPRTPIEIDAGRRHIVGVAIRPGHVEVARVNLVGEVVGDVLSLDVADPGKMIASAAELMRSKVDARTLAVGVTMTGAFDANKRVSVISSSLPGLRNVSLDPLYDAAGKIPVLFENDMAAFAVRWLMKSQVQVDIDVLMIGFGDGLVGGSILVNAGPERGYVVVDNEMGHQRLLVDSPVCYCGRPGCLTMLCSTKYLQTLDAKTPPLLQRVAAYSGRDPIIEKLLDILATGLTNAAHTLFPDRVVLVSEMLANPVFADALLARIRGPYALEHIREIVAPHVPKLTAEIWSEPAGRPSITSAWIGLAWLFLGGWNAQLPDVRAREGTKNPRKKA